MKLKPALRNKIAAAMHGAAFGTALSALTLGACVVDSPDDAPGAAPPESAIVGGSDASIEEYPWQVSLQSAAGTYFFCGGSILSDRWILTAQHCTKGKTPSEMRVVAGVGRLSASNSAGQVRRVSQKIEYEGYRSADTGRDVALLELSRPLELGPRARAIPIVTQELSDSGLTDGGVMSTVTGWGALAYQGAASNVLQHVDVPVISNDKAQNLFEKNGYSYFTVTDDQLAAIDLEDGGEDACQGDSGGPLVVDGDEGKLLAGVVSWGVGCAHPDMPGMYARVSAFEEWIQRHVFSEQEEQDVSTGGEQPDAD